MGSELLHTLVFDCDGVIVIGSHQVYDEALALAARWVQPDLKDDQIRSAANMTRGKTFIVQLQLLLGKDHAGLLRAIEVYEEYIHRPDVFPRFVVIPGAWGALTALGNKGYRLALATGMNPSLLTRLFREKMLPNVFEHVGKVHDIPESNKQKPHPEILMSVLQHLKTPQSEASKVAYVGDTIDDVVMARSAGMLPIVVLTGRLDRKNAECLQPFLIANSILDLPELL